jgi:uncharacterized protein (DUF362 family)
MENDIDRREFLNRTAMAGAGLMLDSSLPGVNAFASPAEAIISVVAGEKIFENTMAAVDALGGMKKFVKKNAVVALLINSYSERKGTFVNPDIPLAVVKMCLEAGASRIVTIDRTPDWFWRRGSHFEKLGQEIKSVGQSGEKKDVTIPGGKSIKDASVSAAMLSSDVFINIPIIKDHRGTRYTGNLKNMMGAFSSSTCRRCHYGDASIVTQVFQDAYGKMDFLSQSIADLNLVRQPDLCIADVTEILSTNGPVGPGKIVTPMEVVAGTNSVAVDMFAVQHLDLNPNDLLVIQRAQEHRLGPKSLQDVRVLRR